MKIDNERAQPLVPWSKERTCLSVLFILAAILAMQATFLAINLHRNFLTTACDTALLHNAVVNTLHGHWFRNTVYCGPQILGIHSTFVLILVAPIYAVFPSVETLFILQIWGIYAMAFPVYFMAKEALKGPLLACFFAAAVILNPMLLRMAMAPFHPETWILTAMFWSYYFYLCNRPIGFWLSFAFAVSCAEQAALIYIVLGIALLCTKEGLPWKKLYGKFALIGGLGWICFSLFLLFPLMRHSDQCNVFAAKYSDLGVDSIWSLLGLMVKKFPTVLTKSFAFDHWKYIAWMIGLPLVFALTSWRSLILLAIFPLYWIQNKVEFFLEIHDYYFQFVFFASYMGLLFLLERWNQSARRSVAVLILIVCAAGIHLGIVFNSFEYELTAGQDDSLNSEFRKVFSTIPINAGVYGPHRYSAYLSNRENFVMGDLREKDLDFETMVNSRFSTTTVHAEEIDFIVCDLANDQCGSSQWMSSKEDAEQRNKNIQRLQKSGRWQIYWDQDDVVILSRVSSPKL